MILKFSTFEQKKKKPTSIFRKLSNIFKVEYHLWKKRLNMFCLFLSVFHLSIFSYWEISN